jgi:hypothetical protein
MESFDYLLDMGGSVLAVWQTAQDLPHRARSIVDRVGDLDHRRLRLADAPANVRRCLANALEGPGPLKRAGGRERAVERILRREPDVAGKSALVATYD